MINDKQKAQLTAYALGELSGSEKKNVEKLLSQDREAQEFVDEVKMTASLLETEFSVEEKPVLTENERSKLQQVWEDRARQNEPRSEKESKGWFNFNWWLMAPAGGLMAAAIAAIVLLPQIRKQVSQEKTAQVDSLNGVTEEGAPKRDASKLAVNKGQRTHIGGKAKPPEAKAPTVATKKRGVYEAQEKEVDFDDANVAGNVGEVKRERLAPTKPSLVRPKSKAKGRFGKKMKNAQSDPNAFQGRGDSTGVSGSGLGIGTAASGPSGQAQKRISYGKEGVRKAPLAKKKMAPGRPASEMVAGMPQDKVTATATATGSDTPPPVPPVEEPDHSGEAYDLLPEADFIQVSDEPLSTFSIDVDTASYSNLRRFVQGGSLPPRDAVRIEEMINYFPYSYQPPKGPHPFAVHTAVASSPWSKNRLVRVALKGKEVDMKDRPAANLVFLLDVSGSMADYNKLPLLKRSFKLLVDSLGKKDKVSVVVYAGASGLVLPATAGNKKDKIMSSLDNLEAGGSTNGGSGIQLAYKVAKENFVKGGINRVILATDGDFNVGTTSRGELIRMISEKAKGGTFLTVLGFGMGNLKDGTMEQLANKGNGNYAYIDSDKEANKVFVEQLAANLVTIAKDVKIQVEFNPAKISSYRLIGYENRRLNKEDFNDDKKDAGEIGAGHTVTALYEVVLVGTPGATPKVDPLKYQTKPAKPVVSKSQYSDELLTVKLRYKKPAGSKSTLMQVPVKDRSTSLGKTDPDFRFATAVASFGMILRDSKHKGTSSFEKVLDWASGAVHVKGKKDSYRQEFLELVRRAKDLKR